MSYCHSASQYNVWISANVTVSPHLRDEILSGSLFWKEGPKCNEGFSANHDLLYHDMEKQFCVWLKYENADGEIELDPGADHADRVFKGHRLRIALARDELIEKIKIDRKVAATKSFRTFSILPILCGSLQVACCQFWTQFGHMKEATAPSFIDQFILHIH